MVKFAAWAVLAAGVLVAAMFALQRLRAPEPEAAKPAGASPFPVVAPAAEGIQRWACPADPAKWPGGEAKAEVLETPRAWQDYLALSGFEPPQRVDLARSRVALVPFIGGGGVSLVDVAAVPAAAGIEVVVKSKDLYRPNDARPQDIRYDCRLVVVPRESGAVSFRSEVDRPAPRAAPAPSRRARRR